MDVSKHRKRIAAACLALLCVIALTAARCTAVHAPQPEPQQEEEGPAAQAEAPADEGEPEAASLLSDADRAKIAAYDGETLDFVALLETNKWVDSAETSTLAFGEGAFTVNRADGSSTQPIAFAVRALDAELLSNGEGTVPVKAYTASVSSAKGDHILRVDQSPDGRWRVSSALFGGGAKATYYMVEDESDLVLEVDEGALDEATGGHSAELADAMRAHCANLYPTARTAAWTGEATTDYSKRTASLAFVLDNRAASRVEVVYDEKEGTFTFGDTRASVPAEAEGEPGGSEVDDDA